MAPTPPRPPSTPLAGRLVDSNGLVTADRAALDAALRLRIDAGRAAWPTARLTDEEFIDALAGHLPADEDPARALAGLCTDDLYLVAACLRGDAGALAAFARAYAAELGAAFRRLAIHGSGPDDLQQDLLERLFTASGERPPRICEYGGRAPLRAWLKVVALRLRIDRERRKRDRADNFTGDDALARLGGDDPELDYLRRHYHDEFKAAFVAALERLEPRERALLRLNTIEGLSATDIARIHDVHRATAKRWLADTRERLVAETQKLLAHRLGERAPGLASIVRLIRGDLDVSLSRHLRG